MDAAVMSEDWNARIVQDTLLDSVEAYIDKAKAFERRERPDGLAERPRDCNCTYAGSGNASTLENAGRMRTSSSRKLRTARFISR